MSSKCFLTHSHKPINYTQIWDMQLQHVLGTNMYYKFYKQISFFCQISLITLLAGGEYLQI